MSDQIDNNADFEVEAEARMTPVCPHGQLYTVKPGDTMFFIAKRYNIPLQELINSNPQVKDPNAIYPGQMICIPGQGFPNPAGRSYRVVKGDTMYEIAKRFGVSLDALVAANPQIKDPNLIYPGQEIFIPGGGGGGTPVPCPNGKLYTVKSGDTMFEIARANNISLAALIMANPQVSDPNIIFPGQVICIPRTVMEMPSPGEMPRPAPIAPCPHPMPILPIEHPMPMPSMPVPAAPCPPGQSYPMPFYIVIPWEECPYRCRKKKHKHEKRHERRCR